MRKAFLVLTSIVLALAACEEPETTRDLPPLPEVRRGQAGGGSEAVDRASGAGNQASGHGPRASGSGPRATGSGPRATGSGPRAAGDGPRASGSGPRAVGNGLRASGTGHRDEGLGDHASGPGNLPSASAETPPPTLSVVLDPGHGGSEWGASADGMRESRLVLDIARRTATHLVRQAPNIRVLLTRDEDITVSLEQRAAMANAAGASLFVSIHLNDAEGHVRNGGVTTFILDTSDEAHALRLAARENGTSEAEVSELSRVLAGLHREEQQRGSLALAEAIQEALVQRARREIPGLADRGVKRAAFYVLVGARMPAVLVEASFLSVPREREALGRAGYRDALAEGIAQGIVAHLRASAEPVEAPPGEGATVEEAAEDEPPPRGAAPADH